MKIRVILLLTSLSLAGCDSSSGSSTQGIATDLRDGDNADATHLYWVEGGEIYRGECDDRFITRTACSRNVQGMEYDTFRVALDNGLSDQIALLETQVQELNGLIDDVSTQISATQEELEGVVADIDLSQAELDATREEMVYLEDIVFEYREQIRLIEEQLAQAKNCDCDLQVMANIIAEDLEFARQTLGAIYNAVADITVRIERLMDYAQELRDQLQPLKDELAALQAELSVIEEELEVNRALFAIYENTLEKLESEINFYITSNHPDLFEANRRYVKLFDTIFSNSSAQ